jgi:class 3 adenylate cyclase/predicted ATPase
MTAGEYQSVLDASAGNAERRHLTVMFCDIAGSTELSSRLDPEDLRELIRAHHGAWRAVIERYGGFVARYMGDGVLAYFGYPRGHEDDAERAAHAALAIVKGPPSPGAATFDVAVRVGIATGLVVVGGLIGEGASEEQPAFGMTPNLAARLQAIAAPNSVAIAAETRRLIGPEFECVELGIHQFRGITEPVSVWRLVDARPVPSRFVARRVEGPIATIGRSEELGVLRQCWSHVCEGVGEVVSVSGEPGIGKSHLCEALLTSISQEPHVVIRWQCSALHDNTAFHPIIEEIERSAGISRQHNAADRLARLETLLRGWSGRIDHFTPLFAALLSLPVRERDPNSNLSSRDIRRRLIDALVQRLLLMSQREPLILLVEDVQWSDPSTQDLLAEAAKRVIAARVVILVTLRPGFEAPWAGISDVTHLNLGRLDRQQSVDLVRHIANDGSVSEDTLAKIVERADGVPFFVEEITKWLLEAGAAAIKADSPRAGVVDQTSIPETLHDPLMSQLDRLGMAKPVAQLAAIIGPKFPYWLLLRLWPFGEESVRASLAEIVKSGLVARWQNGSEDYFAFKHDLVRDAAYESLLKTKRQWLHRRIAEIVTEERASSSDMRPELIAYHYTAAGLSERAAPLWLEAGQLALRESANREARASLVRGLQCLEKVPDSLESMRLELRLQCCLGQALIAISGHASPEMHRAFSRAYQLCLKIHDAPELFSVVWGITAHHFVKGDINLHLRLSEQLLDIAEASNDSAQLIVAHTSRTLSLYYSGQLLSARTHFDEVRARYDWDRHRNLAFSYAVDRKIITYQFGTWILWNLGYPDQAAELEHELHEHARRLNHPNSLAQALTAGASVYMLRREPDRFLERVREGIAVAQSHGYPVWVDHADFWLGWALTEKGSLDEGIAHLRRALIAYQKTGAGSSMPKFLGLLADRLGDVQRHDEGLALLKQAVDHIERTGERANEAETYRLCGKLLASRPTPDFAAAEASLHKAMEVARAQQAKGWELRAATTLAGLLQRRDQRLEARACLDPVYGWFKEGFDTPDLKEAEQLLRQLQ